MADGVPKTCEFCATWETVDSEGTTICTNDASPLFTVETSDGGSCPKWSLRDTLVRCNECGWIGEAEDLGPEGECCECRAHGAAVSPVSPFQPGEQK